MATFGELSGLKQWAIVVGGAVLITVGMHYTLFKSQRDQNAAAQQQLEAKMRENAELEAYRPKLDEIEVDGFMRMMDAEAAKAGIEIRRYTAQPTAQKDFYTEVPFEMELDGPYYSMLGFFDRVGKLERIVNVSSLLVSTTRKPADAKARKIYQYAPNESIVATCKATTFFSHDLDPAGSAKPGQAPVKR